MRSSGRRRRTNTRAAMTDVRGIPRTRGDGGRGGGGGGGGVGGVGREGGMRHHRRQLAEGEGGGGGGAGPARGWGGEERGAGGDRKLGRAHRFSEKTFFGGAQPPLRARG